jgi:signal transduction histidine kinase
MLGYLLPPIVLSASSLILLVTALIASRNKTISHWLFSLYLCGLIAYGAIIYGMRASPDLSLAYSWELRIVGVIPLLSVVMCHFCLVFSEVRHYRWPILAMYVVAGAFIYPDFAPLVVSGMQTRPYGYAPVFGPLALLWLPYLFGPAFWSLVAMWRARRQSSNEKRNRYNYIIAGLIISMIGGAFDLLPTLDLPLYPGAIIGLIAFCILSALAIIKHRLLDIQIVIRRGIAYVIVSAIAGMPYAAVVLALNLFLSQLSERIPVYVLLAIGCAVALQPLWQWAQNAVDRVFLRGRYDFVMELTKLTTKTYSLEQMPVLANGVSKLICGALQCTECRILLRGSNNLLDITSIGQSGSRAVLSLDNPLVIYLEANPGIIRSGQFKTVTQLQAFTKQQQQEIDSLSAVFYAPVIASKNRLVSIIAIGQKQAGMTYNMDDEKVILDTVQRLAVNFENAYLFDVEKSLREGLERETASRTEFLLAAAHEMRTPLTSIMASSELLSADFPLDQADPRSLLIDNIKVSTDILHKRTTELLDFTRLRTTRLGLQKSYSDLPGIIESCTRQMEPVLRQRGQKFKVLYQPLPQINLDASRIEQVILNLLSNASKFSAADSDIGISVESHAENVVVSVIDKAIPLTDFERSRLFEPYYRGDNPGRLPTGLGLGLAISKYLVELHGGKIWAESRPDGNAFLFSLPIVYPE